MKTWIKYLCSKTWILIDSKEKSWVILYTRPYYVQIMEEPEAETSVQLDYQHEEWEVRRCVVRRQKPDNTERPVSSFKKQSFRGD